MNTIRSDIPRRDLEESADAYMHRLFEALNEGEIANGWRRKGVSLERVGENLEHLIAFDEVAS